MPFIPEIKAQGLLSFAPDSESIKLSNLNVLIGPNGSGKSNFIELFEVIKSASNDLAAAIRTGGGAGEWLWKGRPSARSADLDLQVKFGKMPKALRYFISFGSIAERLEVLDERIEELKPRQKTDKDVYFYYRLQGGHPVINVRSGSNGKIVQRKLNRELLDIQQSVLSQRRDPEAYPEITGIAREFSRIFTFREWRFGRGAELRQPQRADHPNEILLPDALNLGLILNQIEHSDLSGRLNDLLRRFLPRFRYISTRVQSGTVQIFLHEEGLTTPIAATRLSDGTIRFIALLVMLLRPELASVICIEEPELGLHPDALHILAELIKEASRTTQVIVTTHSETLLSEFSEQSEDVLVCENLNGHTFINRLDPEKLAYWLDKYSLGDVWKSGELGGKL